MIETKNRRDRKDRNGRESQKERKNSKDRKRHNEEEALAVKAFKCSSTVRLSKAK